MAEKKPALPGLPVGIAGALKLLPLLWKYGSLTWSLMQDRRVPVYARVALIVGLGLVFSPLDLLPSSIPFVGQISDIVMLLAVLQIFLRLVPASVVDEHITKLGLEGQVKVLLRM